MRWLMAQSGLQAGIIKLILEHSKATLHEQFGQGACRSVLMIKLGEGASKDQNCRGRDLGRFAQIHQASKGIVW
jgi:hypothetical protein